MQGHLAHRVLPQLRSLVTEASKALARLDAARLEELALSCQALNRDLTHNMGRDSRCDLEGAFESGDSSRRAELALEASAARSDLAVFGRVLEATRSNLAVMERIRALRAGRPLEYRPEFPMNGAGPRSEYGNH